jgi:hypothetical protein
MPNIAEPPPNQTAFGYGGFITTGLMALQFRRGGQTMIPNLRCAICCR